MRNTKADALRGIDAACVYNDDFSHPDDIGRDGLHDVSFLFVKLGNHAKLEKFAKAHDRHLVQM